MCPYIPFQTSLTGQKRWGIVYAGHSSSLPNNMHTKFMCPSLYHFANSSYRSEEMGTLVMLATVNVYPTTVLFTLFLWNHILKILKSMAETNISYFNELPSHTTTLRIKNPPNFISIRIQRYAYTHIAAIFKYVFVLSNPHEN
jgi:hypothetical protein